MVCSLVSGDNKDMVGRCDLWKGDGSCKYCVEYDKCGYRLVKSMVKKRAHLEYYLSCLDRDDLDFYYRYHKPGKHLVFDEEII